MQYIIRMGVPEMSGFWNDLLSRRKLGTLSNKELELFNRIAKTLQHLSVNPRHTGLRTHEIEPLSRKYGF